MGLEMWQICCDLRRVEKLLREFNNRSVNINPMWIICALTLFLFVFRVFVVSNLIINLTLKICNALMVHRTSRKVTDRRLDWLVYKEVRIIAKRFQISIEKLSNTDL